MKQNKILLSLLGVMFIQACGDDRDGVSGSLEMGTLNISGSTLTAQSYSPSATADTNLIESTTNYSYAYVDGIKLTVAEVRGADANSNNPLTQETIGEEIELKGDASEGLSFSKAINWEVGSYEGVDILVANKWKVKAYCKTAVSGGNYTLVYTTATGVSTQSCSTGSACTLPTAYDYYEYSWLDDYYTQQGEANKWVSTRFNFEIAEGDSPKVSLFFDPVNAVVCWDGQNRTSGDFGYFNSMLNSDSSRASTLWPNGTPAFAIVSPASFPLIAYVRTSETEEAPVGRTFFTAASNSTLQGSLASNLENTYTVTMLFKADGTPVTGATRPYPGTSSSIPLNGDLEGFTANGSGWDFFDSNFRWDGTSNPAAYIRNRKFEGWTLPTTRYSVFSSSVVDGDGCGQTLLDFQNNDQSRDCITGGTQTYYWKEVEK